MIINSFLDRVKDKENEALRLCTEKFEVLFMSNNYN